MPANTTAITVQAAALRLGISEEAVQSLCRRGLLTAEKHGRDWRIEGASVARRKRLARAGKLPKGGRPRKG